jgi:SAM-dependent methyltransferase
LAKNRRKRDFRFYKGILLINQIINFISYKIIPLLTLDIFAPNVAPWNASFLNWFYLKKAMIYTSKKYISGICIDIGSGNSPYKKYLNVSKYISIDKKDTNATTYKDNSNEINADARELPIENNYADTVLLNQVLEHIYEYDQVIKEIYRILKKDGKFIISVPFIYHIHSEPNDFFRFSEYGIKKLLEENKFKILEFKYNGYFGTTIFSIINSFLWQVWNKNLFFKFLRNTIFLIPLFIIFLLNNILGLLLDKIKSPKFSPNYFIICEKIDE